MHHTRRRQRSSAVVSSFHHVEEALFFTPCPNVVFLPKADDVRKQWLKCILNSVPEHYNPNLVLCFAHLTEDSFHNMREYSAGFTKKLLLKNGAVPI